MIISASRRTDIPAYYSEWFLNRLKEGFADVRNPMVPKRVSRVPLDKDCIDCIVFWSKNPKSMLKRLKEIPYPFYFQFTLTPYGKETEPNLPDKQELIETFRELSRMIGKERVIWRYDPIILGGDYTEAYHEAAFRELCKAIGGYARQCDLSFLDLYRRNKKAVSCFSTDETDYFSLAGKLFDIAKKYGASLYACCEQESLSKFGIRQASCIDAALIEEITGRQIKWKSDKNQRPGCHCIESVDIGAYHCCPNGCIYCYANASEKVVKNRFQSHDPYATMLTGCLTELDVLTDRKIRT